MSAEDFAERSFSRLDRDDDGVISAAEIEAAQERWAERSQRRERAPRND